MAGRDPYEVLGVGASASAEELRAAYRRLVQLHHPDHNAGSAEAARRFEEVQDAYARVVQMRRGTGAGGAGAAGAAGAGAAAGAAGAVSASVSGDPEVEARVADLERQVREAHLARERAQRAAAEAAAQSAKRPSDEELGYYKTDDSLSKLLDDAASQLSQRFADAGTRPARKRAADLLDKLSDRLSGHRPDEPRSDEPPQ